MRVRRFTDTHVVSGSLPDRFPDIDLADPVLPIRIQLDSMCPLRDEVNEKQVNIIVGALRVYLRTKQREILMLSLCGGKIVRDPSTRMPTFHVAHSTKQHITIGREIREALMRHILANPLVGRYCRDKFGKGGIGQWQKSRASTALHESIHSNPQSA